MVFSVQQILDEDGYNKCGAIEARLNSPFRHLDIDRLLCLR